MLTLQAFAGIVTNTTPAVAAALSVLFLGERLTPARAGGIGLAVLGILALNLARPAEGTAAGADPFPGNLLVFGAVIGEALFIICGKVAAARVPPLTAATTLSVLGFLMFLPFTLVLWARGLAVVPASTAAVFTTVLPVSAVLLSYALLGERFAWSHVVVGACVIAGIALLARARR